MERTYSNYFNVISSKILKILVQIKEKGEQLTAVNIKKYLASDPEILSFTKELNAHCINFVEDIKKAFNNNSHHLKKYLNFEDLELISRKLDKLNAYNLLNEMSEIIAILGKYYSEYEDTLEKIYSFVKEFSQKMLNIQSGVQNLKDENLKFIDEDSEKDENILSTVRGLRENLGKNLTIDNLQKQIIDLTNSLTEILEQKIYSKRNFKRNLNSAFGGLESDFISYKDKYEELKKEIDNYKKQSVTDELTGLYRKNKMFEVLAELKNLAIKKDEDFYILMSDIDKFKDVNDTYGHLAGDNVLKHFGKILKNLTDENIQAFRYGGEEFLITVKGSYEDALSVASQIRSTMENTKFKLNNDTKTITVSIGIAKYKTNEDVKSTIDRADKNLYMAKAGGRNCIFFESRRVG